MLSIWYCFCLLFLLNNIYILIDESYEVTFKIINQNESIQYLNCVNLSEIIINKTRINLNKIKNDFNYHLRWIQKNKKGKLISNETIEKILNQTKSRDYFIFQNRICFISGDFSDFRLLSTQILNLQIVQDYFVFNNETFSFFKLESIFSKFNQILIQHIESPYSSCSKDYLNFKCLNDKIKGMQRLSRYYYGSDDNESIELNYQINQTIMDNEIEIIKQCNQIDCTINLFYLNTAASISDKKSGTVLLKSFLYISNLDFYLQLIGLVVLFLNITIYKLIIKFINSINLRPLKIKILRVRFIKLKLKKFKKKFKKFKLKMDRIKLFKLIKRKCLKINYFIISILLICLFILSSRSIYNYIEGRDNPSTKSISVDSIKSDLLVVICINIRDIKGADYNIYNKSLLKIENDTDNGLNSVVKDINLQFLNRKIETKWQLESKIIVFKGLFRCFQLRINLNQPKYQKIFSVTKLIIEFKKNKYGDIYILTDNELFNSKSYQHFSYYSFRKRMLERSKLNRNKKCKDFNLVDDNFISKWNCIDRCVNREVYNQIKNLTGNNDLIIDKKYFNDKEWSNLYIRPNSINHNEIYKNISKECNEKYSKFDPCIDIKFEHQSLIKARLDDEKEIDFNYEVINYKEDEVSIFKLSLDLLNIQSILFGLNVLKILLTLLFKLKLRFKIILKSLIYLICLIGFVAHIWFIFDEIINGQLIASEYYEINSTIHTPDLIFCFDFNHTKLINQNYKLTYKYFDRITSNELRKDKIFTRVEYLNQSNIWTKLDSKKKFKDNNLEIKIFYYLDKKCFKIRQKVKYNKNQFEFNKMEDDGLILKIFFNRKYLNNKIFYFFTKTKHKIQFSKIQELNLKDDYSFYSFVIRHEIIKSDKFNLINSPFLSNEEDLNDSDKLFRKLLDHLEKRLNLVTSKLPFKKDNSNSNYELDDNLFIQLYNDLDKKMNQTNLNVNFQRQYAINYLEIAYDYDLKFDFKFCLNFAQKVVVVTNEVDTAKILINLLNAVSFWFNLCIFDLHTYLYLNKIRLFLIYSYRLFLKFRKRIFLRIIYDDWYY